MITPGSVGLAASKVSADDPNTVADARSILGTNRSLAAFSDSRLRPDHSRQGIRTRHDRPTQ
jgi:hypothetical protein